MLSFDTKFNILFVEINIQILNNSFIIHELVNLGLECLYSVTIVTQSVIAVMHIASYRHYTSDWLEKYSHTCVVCIYGTVTISVCIS